VEATVEPWTSTSGCNSTGCVDDKTPQMPVHGHYTWVAELRPTPAAGGEYTIAVSVGTGVNETIVMERVTYGDVYYCSGQSNMALQSFFTFSADTLKDEIEAGKYPGLRHFMYGSMSDHFEALAPQYVVSWNSVSADPGFTWYNTSYSASLPSSTPSLSKSGHASHSPWASFSATCMYFGAELITAREAQGLEPVPIGLIQSAIGGYVDF
jgi:hypothetical protein